MDILKELSSNRKNNDEYQQNKLLEDAYKILNAHAKPEIEENDIHFKETILKTKALDYKKVFSKVDIKAVCINNRLRFLDKKHYKSTVPYDVHLTCSAFEIEANKPINFKILTEAANFKANYPNTQHFIFADMGNNEFYFLRNWGNQYPDKRKFANYPFKNAENLLLSVFAFALILTAITPTSFLTTNKAIGYFSMIRIAFYFWSVIFLAAISIYYVVAIRKNLNDNEWDDTSFF